jgi:hypothetical protein
MWENSKQEKLDMSVHLQRAGEAGQRAGETGQQAEETVQGAREPRQKMLNE